MAKETAEDKMIAKFEDIHSSIINGHNRQKAQQIQKLKKVEIVQLIGWLRNKGMKLDDILNDLQIALERKL